MQRSRRTESGCLTAIEGCIYNLKVQPIIIAEHLSKTYKSGKIEVPALRDVTFSIESGEFVSVVGPSGSGKSTLFYILGGLARATSGTLFIDGIDSVALGDAERTRMRRRASASSSRSSICCRR